MDTPLLDNAAFQYQGHQQVLDIFVPMKRKGRSEEVAHLIAYLLGEEASCVSGGIYNVDGGMLA